RPPSPIRKPGTTTPTTCSKPSSRSSPGRPSPTRTGPPMPDFEARWNRARDAMRAAGLDGMLLTTEPSVYYFSGTVGSRPPGLIVPTDQTARPILVCRDAERDSVAALTDLEVVPAGKGEAGKVLADVIDRLGLKNSLVGFEDASMTVADHAALQASLGSVRLPP